MSRKSTASDASASEANTGTVQVLLHRRKGTFKIYSIDQRGAPHNLLQTYNEGTSSFFALKIDKDIFRLQDSIVKISGKKTDDGGKLTFLIRRRAEVVIDFAPYTSQKDGAMDAIRVEAKIRNITRKPATFAFKAVFDTILGEPVKQHFATRTHQTINHDFQFSDFRNNVYVSSADENDMLNFLLYGGDVTAPHIVSLGPKSLLTSNVEWIPPISPYRPFDNVNAYNDSAVAINWDEKLIDGGEVMTVVFYITAASDRMPAVKSAEGLMPVVFETKKDVANFTKENTKENQAAENTVTETPVANTVVGPVLPQNDEPKTEIKETNVPEQNLESELEELLANLSDEDYAYIRALIEKIYALESDSELNAVEIEMLHNELDMFISELRR